MKIKPLGNLVQIKVDEVHAGVLNTSSKETGIEYGEVVAVGDKVGLQVKAGDKVFFKAWAVDIITYEDKKYYFICPDTNGLLAVVE
jgi:co-chaperonin GroES (HSP10)